MFEEQNLTPVETPAEQEQIAPVCEDVPVQDTPFGPYIRKPKKLEFRDLTADEIDCRISTFKEGEGLSLLLYKDARCDMNVLDETVGPFNWKRAHSRDNANCTVSIWDDFKCEWVSKEDTGTESNTEAEKGLASDSFKRACFNWGIGRELYTAPFIWIKAGLFRSKYDKFEVQEIRIVDKKIVALAIYNKTLKRTVYTYGETEAQVESDDFAPRKRLLAESAKTDEEVERDFFGNPKPKKDVIERDFFGNPKK